MRPHTTRRVRTIGKATRGGGQAGLWVGLPLLAGLVTLSACTVDNASSTEPAPTPSSSAVVAPPPASASPGASPSAVPQFRSVRRYDAVALPVRLRIPEAGVDTGLTRLGLTPEGWIEAPTEWQVAGWYEGGPRPGQDGPAVIVGHIDSRSGPAVFHDLPQLRPGAAVHVDRADGSTVTFRVTGRRQVPKDRFPAAEVYAPTLQPSLVLITCGGVFDRTSGHYRDNVLVTAVPG